MTAPARSSKRPSLSLSRALSRVLSRALSRALCPALIAAFGLSGCAPKGDDTGAADSDTQVADDTQEEFSCPTPEIHVNGDDPPSVGDYWEVFLWCDHTLMTGAMHMGIDPPSMATVDDYHMTFNEAGTGQLTVQVGTISGTREVEVAE